jgi:acylphosphatase
MADAAPPKETKRFRAVVHGRVQGVGFRYAAQQEALAAGLHGYARNRPDGDVEIVAEGPVGAIELYLRWVHRGPRLAHVLRVDLTWQAPLHDLDTFEVRF